MLRSILLSAALLFGGCATAPGTQADANATPALTAEPFPETGSAAARTRAALGRINRIEPQVNAVIAIEPLSLIHI
jgi:uncharacterized lipoprotein YajG